MMHGIRNLLWLVPLLLVVGWPLYGDWLAAFLAPPEVPEAGELRQRYGEDEEQRFNMESVLFYQETDGNRRWRLESRRLRTGGSGEDLLLTMVAATFFREGEPGVWVDAARGRYDTEDQVLILEDDVRLRDAEGFLLTTEALSYHEGEERVSSRVGVEVSDDNLRVRGQNLDYFLADGSYDLTGNVELLSSPQNP